MNAVTGKRQCQSSRQFDFEGLCHARVAEMDPNGAVIFCIRLGEQCVECVARRYETRGKMTDDTKAKPTLGMIGQSELEREKLVERFKRIGRWTSGRTAQGQARRQGGRPYAVRAGGQGHAHIDRALVTQGKADGPDSGHRGKAVPFTSDAATGARSAAGCGGAGLVEHPGSGSAGGEGQALSFAAILEIRNWPPR